MNLKCVVMVWTLLAAIVATAADPPTDYDRRASLTLVNTAQTDFVYAIADITDEAVETYLQEKDQDGTVYVLRFGARTADSDTRGYYKINVGHPPADPVAKGWTLFARDDDTGTETFWKRVERSTAARWTYVAARREISGVELLVTQRRPFGENPRIGTAEMRTELNRLVDQATKNRLFAEIVITLRDPGSPLGELGGQTVRMPAGTEGKDERLALRVEVRDPRGYRLEGIDRFAFALEGPLAEFVRVEQAKWNEELQRYVVRDRNVADFDLVVAAASPKLTQAIHQRLLTGARLDDLDAAGVRVKTGVRFDEKARSKGGAEYDLEDDFGVNVLDWDLMIQTFELVSERHLKSRVIAREAMTPVKSLPGLEAAWKAMKPLIRPHDEGIPPAEKVMSGWRLDLESRGLRFLAHQADGEKVKLATHVYNQPVVPLVDLHVVIPAQALEQERILDTFRVLETVVSVHPVSDDPVAIRDPVSSSRPAQMLCNYEDLIGIELRDFDRAIRTLIMSFQARTQGVYEVRVRIKIEGNVGSLPEHRTTRMAVGAIRVAFGSEPYRIDRLEYESIGGFKLDPPETQPPDGRS